MSVSWTYNPEQLATSALFQVRLLVGDTDINDQLFQDGEINHYISRNPNSVTLAAAEVCEGISAKFARWTDASVDGVSESASQKSERYSARAKELKQDAYSLALPVFGGITVAQQQAADQNTDMVQPSFKIGENDNPETINERTTPRRDWPGWP